MGKRRNPLDIEQVILGIGDGLPEERLGVGAHRRPPRLDIVGVLHEADLNA